MPSFKKSTPPKCEAANDKPKKVLPTQKAALWEEENAEAINEQNGRIVRRGVFMNAVRRF
jgi:post-segregation antitoxin (ccd killing protein)